MVIDDNILDTGTDNDPSSSFIPSVQQVQTEEQAIKSTIAGNDPLQWPPLKTTPINEFNTKGLVTMVFPTLFPYGKGDPICKGGHHAVHNNSRSRFAV